METRGFFPNRRGLRLFFCAHGNTRDGVGWIFCNPFLEEKTFTHSVYVALARRLAAEGHFVMRFDFTGDGDSEGDLSAIGLGDWVDDVVDASVYARAAFGLTRPRLFGLRLGSGVALLAAAAVRAVQVLAWEPVVRGTTYLQECLMFNVTTQLATYKRVREDRKALCERIGRGQTMNILGHEIGKAMADSIEAFVLADAISASGCPVDIITVLKSDAAAPSQELQVLASRSGVTVQGQRATPFWLEPKIIEAPPAAMWEASRHALERRFVNSSGAA